MKTMATVFPDQKDARRVPKPLMEKRRRDRINHSLETLRLLLLENTRNEKLKNPKVEKAEILESVVNFLRTEQEEEHEHQPMKRVHSREIGGEQGSPCKRKQNYREGMRSCLLRVSHFIATKSQELEETSDTADTMPQTSTVLPSLTHPPPPALQLHGAIAVASTHDYSPLPGQLPMRQPPPLGQVPHPHTGHGPNRSPQTMELSDSVWRPWPQ